MDELISVIIPVYNVEKYLERCIESVLNQTYKYFEIILVDDGSNDKSGEICDNYANIYTKIKVIHKENGGLSDARNVGIENSIGEYIFFLDSDDYIDCKVLEILYLNIKKYNAGISTCEYKIVSEKSNYLNEVKFLEEIKYKEEIWNKEQSYIELLLFGKIENYIWNKLYKRKIFDEVRFPIGRKMEDVGTMYLLLDKSEKLVKTSYVGYYYVIREGSIMACKDDQLIKDTRDMVNTRFNYLKLKYPNLLEQLMINRLVFIKFYFEDIGKINKKEMIEIFDEEYEFYKKNYKKYRNQVIKTSKSKIKGIDFDLLYINKKFLVNLNVLKRKLKEKLI